MEYSHPAERNREKYLKLTATAAALVLLHGCGGEQAEKTDATGCYQVRIKLNEGVEQAIRRKLTKAPSGPQLADTSEIENINEVGDKLDKALVELHDKYTTTQRGDRFGFCLDGNVVKENPTARLFAKE